MKKILAIDDNSVCLSLAKSMLSERYNVSAVLSGAQALSFLEKKETDLILLDINMPDMSGFETLKKIRENPVLRDIPIIFLTSDTSPETERKCFEMGAYDFIVKPFQKATLLSRVSRTLDLLDLQRNLQGQLLTKTKQIARISLKSMMMIANTVDKKDPHASDHSSNVAWFAVEIAKRLGWSTEDLYNLQNLALVHDIGNIGVSDSIIRKNGPLTSDEFEAVKKHTLFGKNILQDMTVIHKAAEIAETHHERYDGKGYPHGLSGDSIPVESRIIAVADAFDSMSSDRSYRPKLSTQEILAELKKGRGTQFDPGMADIAIDLINEGNLEHTELESDFDNDISLESSKLLQKVLQEYTREVRSEAQRDALTGLWNRVYMSDCLNDYLTDKRHNGCFFMIDIDGFKNLNDTYGHIAGDDFIIRLAKALQDAIRADDLICRIGGDEFAIFVKGSASRSFAAAKCEEIILFLDNNLHYPDDSTSLSISIGIALAPVDGYDFDSLYRRADKAMYFVKENGKHNYHFFSEEGEEELQVLRNSRVDLENLRRFIEEKDTSQGAYQVEYESFKKIYRFLARAQRRTSQPILLLLFTLTDYDGDVLSGELLNQAFVQLKSAVTTSIRAGDVATNYSSSQYIAILVDTTPSNGYLVAERIRKLFYDNIKDVKIKLNYDLDTTSYVASPSDINDNSADGETEQSNGETE